MSKVKTSHIRYVNLTNTANLEAYINETCVRADKLKDRIQIAAVGIMSHVGTHRNKPQAVRVANILLNGLGKSGIQVQALMDWFLKYGMLLDVETNQIGDVNLDIITPLTHSESKCVHWVSFVPPVVYKGFNLSEKVEALFKAADSAIDVASEDTEKAERVSVDENMLQVLKFVAGLDSQGLSALMQSANMISVDAETSEAPTDFVDGTIDATTSELAELAA